MTLILAAQGLGTLLEHCMSSANGYWLQTSAYNKKKQIQQFKARQCCNPRHSAVRSVEAATM
eukprot:1395626-Alexandrium_andersonii.AAC.1